MELSLEETFSDKDHSGDLFDEAGWMIGGWQADSENHTLSPAASQSAFAYASSGFGCAIGSQTNSLTKRILLGDNPKLSYYRKLELRAAVNFFTSAAFKVLVEDTVVDEESVVWSQYAESDWTKRADIDLSPFANQTVSLTFEATAFSNVCLEVYAKAWVDDIIVSNSP
jgi:hypothetical protein